MTAVAAHPVCSVCEGWGIVEVHATDPSKVRPGGPITSPLTHRECGGCHGTGLKHESFEALPLRDRTVMDRHTEAEKRARPRPVGGYAPSAPAPVMIGYTPEQVEEIVMRALARARAEDAKVTPNGSTIVLPADAGEGKDK